MCRSQFNVVAVYLVYVSQTQMIWIILMSLANFHKYITQTLFDIYAVMRA